MEEHERPYAQHVTKTWLMPTLDVSLTGDCAVKDRVFVFVDLFYLAVVVGVRLAVWATLSASLYRCLCVIRVPLFLFLYVYARVCVCVCCNETAFACVCFLFICLTSLFPRLPLALFSCLCVSQYHYSLKSDLFFLLCSLIHIYLPSHVFGLPCLTSSACFLSKVFLSQLHLYSTGEYLPPQVLKSSFQFLDICIAISDAWKAIKPHVMVRIFFRFFRSESTRRENTTGRGDCVR